MNTVRETLIKQALGEIDDLVARLERVSPTFKDADAKLAETADALHAAIDKYRSAVAAFTEASRDELAAYLEQRAGQVKAKTAEEMQIIMQEAARFAFRTEAVEQAAELSKQLAAYVSEARKAQRQRFIEYAFVSAATAALTIGGMALLR